MSCESVGRIILVTALMFFASASAAPLGRTDILFLNRITYGVNASTARQYQSMGRENFLQSQMVYRADEGLPVEVKNRIADMDVSKLGVEELIAERHASEQQINASLDPDVKNKLQQAMNLRAQVISFQSSERSVLRSLYSKNQLQELLTWFWFNHFNVFKDKEYNSILMPDYEERAIRPHVLGKFRELLLATLTHPAMLTYLDNEYNGAGSINENYAREIMELHTMGVDGGYTQGDVESLARILTGVGTDMSGKECLDGKHWLPNVAPSDIFFCFDPKRHDKNSKVFLGQNFPAGGGPEEVVKAVNILVGQKATAHYISRELAVYFLDDNPPQQVVDEMAKTFSKTDGDIAMVLAVLFESKEFNNNKYAGQKFKDPTQYVLSSMRLLYDDRLIKDIRLPVKWMNQMSEPMYAHLSPDGYGMRRKDWLNADQMAKRFEIARAIVFNSGALYTSEMVAKSLEGVDQKKLQALNNVAKVDNPIDTFGIYELMLPVLSDNTSSVLRKKISIDECNILLLYSPEFMYR